MSDGKNGYVLWGINIAVLVLLGLLTWNANRVFGTVDTLSVDVDRLKQESVRWGIVADDVKEIKADMKQLLRKP